MVDIFKNSLFLSMVMMCSYFICIIIAVSYFPGYTIYQNYISDGGSPYANPEGWKIWMVGHVLNGIFMLFIVRLDSKKMITFQPKIENPTRTYQHGKNALYLSSIGFIFMGLVPNWHGVIWDIFHGIFAFFILGGYYIGMLSWSRYMRYTEEISKPFSKTITGITLFAPLGTFIALIIVLFLEDGILNAINGEGIWILTVPFWEWMLMFGSYSAFVIMSIKLGKIKKD